VSPAAQEPEGAASRQGRRSAPNFRQSNPISHVEIATGIFSQPFPDAQDNISYREILA
jgi:hypothetical protein